MKGRMPYPGSRPKPASWVDDALCAREDQDPEAFTGDDLRQRVEGKRLCAQCPVLLECANHAFVYSEPHNVWGGLTPFERRRAKRLGMTPNEAVNAFLFVSARTRGQRV